MKPAFRYVCVGLEFPVALACVCDLRIHLAQAGPATVIEVKCGVLNLSFSAHADGKGVMQMVRRIAPRNVVLVHGEAGKMEQFKSRVVKELGLPCYDPANHVRVRVCYLMRC